MTKINFEHNLKRFDTIVKFECKCGETFISPTAFNNHIKHTINDELVSKKLNVAIM